MDVQSISLEPEEVTWLLTSFGVLYEKSIDAEALKRECATSVALHDLEKIAAGLGLEVAAQRIVPPTLETMTLPIAVELRSVEPGGRSAWHILIQKDATRALLVSYGEQTPQTMPRTELEQRMTGQALRVRAAMPETSDPDMAAMRTQPFGFRWFVPELLKHKRIWREIIIASLVLQILALAFPLFTQTIIDKVVVHHTQSTLVALGIGMGVFVIFTTVLTWVRQYLVLHTGNRVDAVLGRQVFEHLFRLPPAYFQNRPTGVIAARMQGIESIREFVSSAAVTLVLDLPFLLIFLAVMFWYSVQLTFVVLGILALIVTASLLVAPLFQRRLNEQFLRGAANQAFLTEYVAGLETVKSLQLEPQLNRRYGDLLADYLGAALRTRQLGNSYGTLAGGFEQIMNLLILVLGAWLVMSTASFTIGMLVAFQMFSSRLSQPMLRIVGLWQQFQQARISVQRLGDIMNVPTEPYRLTRARAAAGAGGINIESLAFRYDARLQLLFDDFTCKVGAGQLVAIMGPSGSGKSTLAKLLQGFYQPSAGSIRIDGTDTRYMAANELRGYFGVVPQETTLFSGTILDNLRIANPFATFEQVVAACKMAEVHSVVEALPNGYQTEIGERGAGLSGGQRQRLAIARALLKGPRILIFDEATSSLDPQTAEMFGRTVNSLKGRVTILFIAHALPRTLLVDSVVRIGEKLSVVPADSGAGGAQR